MESRTKTGGMNSEPSLERHAIVEPPLCSGRTRTLVAASDKVSAGDGGDATNTEQLGNIALSDHKHLNSGILNATLRAPCYHEDIVGVHVINDKIAKDEDEDDDETSSYVSEHETDEDNVDENHTGRYNYPKYVSRLYSEKGYDTQEEEPDDAENYLYHQEYSSQEKAAEYIDKSSPYQHEPLTNASKQLRLLRFIPSTHPGVMAFVLQTFQVDAAPPYVAISYVWGSSEKSHWIDVAGQYLGVTQNCHYALWQVAQQLESEELYVWVDSVSIEQSNLDEKAAQVRMMGDFYERASTVYACVGKHSSNSRQLLLTMRTLQEEFLQSEEAEAHDAGQVFSWLDDRLHREWGVLTTNEDTVSTGNSHSTLEHAHHAFCNREYWNRVWIIQETWLAHNLQILCGETACSVAPFALLWQLRDEHMKSGKPSECSPPSYLTRSTYMHCTLSYSRHLPAQGAVSSFGVLYTLPSSWQRSAAQVESSAWSIDIITALSEFDFWECTDFRDRVYALQRLVAWPRGTEPLIPDYKITALELFHQIMAKLCPFIERGHCLFIEMLGLLECFGLGRSYMKLERLFEERAITQRDHCQEPVLCSNRASITFPWTNTPLNICEIQATADAHMWADLAEVRPESLWPLTAEEINRMSEAIYKSRHGYQLHSNHCVAGRLPENAQHGDLLLKVGVLSSPGWLVLRESGQRSTFSVEGIALLGPQWEAGIASKSSPLGKSIVRLFMSPDDLLLFTSMVCGEYEDGSVRKVDHCLTMKLTCSSDSSYVVIEPESDRSPSEHEGGGKSSSKGKEVTCENLLNDR